MLIVPIQRGGFIYLIEYILFCTGALGCHVISIVHHGVVPVVKPLCIVLRSKMFYIIVIDESELVVFTTPSPNNISGLFTNLGYLIHIPITDHQVTGVKSITPK